MTQNNSTPTDDTTDVDLHPAAADVDDVDVLESIDDVMANTSLVQALGDTPRIRILAALVNARPRPVTISRLKELTALGSRNTVYTHVEALEEVGLVEDLAGDEGYSQIAIVDPDDDRRTEWLEKLQDWTGAYRRDGSRPDTDA